MSQAAAQISNQAREALTLEQALQQIASLEKSLEIYREHQRSFSEVAKENHERARHLEQSNRTLRLAVDLAAARDQDVAELLAHIIQEAHSRNHGAILTLAADALRRLA